MDTARVPWKDWKVVRQIGKGSYGTVYEIERTLGSDSEKSAMKVIPIPPSRQVIEDAYSEGYDDESVLNICKSMHDETLKEYKLMSSLKGHPNIVSCEEIATLSTNDSIGWNVYIRMELLTPLLQSLVSSQMSEEEVIKLGKDICQALVQCEEKDIVHRDIKPGNIFVDARGNYKLGDFGVARTLDHATNATRAGTERFMAPEVIARKPYDKSVDIYSLGLVMYWLLNGRRMPFLKPGKVPTHQEQEKAYSRRLSGETLWLPQYGSLPLRKIVLKACSFNRLDRYQTAREMLDSLNQLGSETHKQFKNDVNKSSRDSEQFKTRDETIGNSWADEGETVAPNFTNNHANSDVFSSLDDDSTAAPDWINKKSRQQTSNRGVNQEGYYHFVYGKNNSENSNNKNTFNRDVINDTPSYTETNSIPKPKIKRVISQRARKVLGTLFILFFIIPGIVAFVVGIFEVFEDSSNTTTSTSTKATASVPVSTLKKGADGKWGMYYEDGTLNKLYTDFAQNKDTGDWFYIEDGYVDWDFTGIARNNQLKCWYYVTEGKADFSVTGDLEFENGSKAYIKNGKVMEGVIISITDGKEYVIKNGEEYSQ